MKILFYLGHPAHFYLFKNVISELKIRGHKISILIKKKDILEYLLDNSDFNYTNILPKGRNNSIKGMAWGLAKRDMATLNYCIKERPDIMLGTSIVISHIGKLLNIPSVIVNEDDSDIVPLFSKLSYPFADNILAPVSCSTGGKHDNWERKTIHYEGFHELAYLHPNHFNKDKRIVRRYLEEDVPFYIIRLAKLTAHHDADKEGISDDIVIKIVKILKSFGGKIFISAERELPDSLKKYNTSFSPLDMHHFLAYADLYIGDSQTMAAEAAVLGTPSIRFNDFVGKIGYLNELEYKYNLTFGIDTNSPSELYRKINQLLRTPNLKNEFQQRRKYLLQEKIDVAAFLVWFVEKYPDSVKIMKENPDQQYSFM